MLEENYVLERIVVKFVKMMIAIVIAVVSVNVAFAAKEKNR